MENETIAKGVFAVKEKSAEIREKAIEKTAEIKEESSRKINELHKGRRKDSSSEFTPVVPQPVENKVDQNGGSSDPVSVAEEPSTFVESPAPEPAKKGRCSN